MNIKQIYEKLQQEQEIKNKLIENFPYHINHWIMLGLQPYIDHESSDILQFLYDYALTDQAKYNLFLSNKSLTKQHIQKEKKELSLFAKHISQSPQYISSFFLPPVNWLIDLLSAFYRDLQAKTEK